MTIRPVQPVDGRSWEEMRHALWPAESGVHAGEISRFFAGPGALPLEVLLAYDDHDAAIGFIELNIRSCVDSCESNNVGYVEGWYVVPHARRQGVGAALIRAGETWARSQGCTEFASDALLENEVSAAVHRAVGFEETARVVCFRKML